MCLDLLNFLPVSLSQFVDLCILLGCDYCEKIGGLGPSRALKLIKQHHTIEGVMEHVNRKVLVQKAKEIKHCYSWQELSFNCILLWCISEYLNYPFWFHRDFRRQHSDSFDIICSPSSAFKTIFSFFCGTQK